MLSVDFPYNLYHETAVTDSKAEQSRQSDAVSMA